MSDPVPVTTRPAGLRAQLRRAFASRFLRDSARIAGINGVERAAALLQTIVIARVLGMAEYGVYGLLFNTIGLVASVVGLQMGLTATVLLARYRDHDKPKAAAVIRHVLQFGWLVALAVCVVALPFARPLSEWLLADARYATTIMLSAAFIGLALVSGIQDGIAQGFEDFRAVAATRFYVVLLGLLLIWPAAKWARIDGIVGVMLVCTVVKMWLLQHAIRRQRRTYALPKTGHGIDFTGMVMGFSLPSMLASLLLGGVTWWGSVLLSRVHRGFEDVALVNTGLQWRGPILLLAASIGAVAVPAFSRLAGGDNAHANFRFRNRLLWMNTLGALALALAVIVCAPLLLALYGKGFRDGTGVFMVLVATTVPMVISGVYMQQLVGAGRLWRQLWLHVPMVLLMLAGFWWSIPRYGGLGYAWTTAAGALVMLASAVLGRGKLPIAEGNS